MANETNIVKEPKSRKKPDGPRGYVVRNGDKLRVITADEVRVATPDDLMKALRGEIPSETAREVVQA